MAGSDDDGFQDFLSDEEEQDALLAQESVALERRMKTLGIRDGLELGKEDTLQLGFDEGFARGAARSFRFARLRGALGTAAACGLLASQDETLARACMARLRALEMDTSVQKDAEVDALSEEAQTAMRQAQALLTTIGMDLPASSK